MQRFNRLCLKIIIGLVLFTPSFVAAQGVPVNYPGEEHLNEIQSWVDQYNKKVTKVSELKTEAEKTITEGYPISAVKEAVSEVQTQAGEAIAGVKEDALSGASGQAGDGFALSKKADSSKGAYTEYAQKQITSGKLTEATVTDLYIDNSNDYITPGDIKKIRSNIKQFIYGASKTTFADATQVMNATTEFGTTKVAATNASKQAINVKEDIDEANGSSISMNVMTYVLLSMDTTILGVRAGTIYQEINSLKSTNTSKGIAGIIGN